MISIKDPVTTLKGISEGYAKKLEKLGILTLKDLYLHFPRAYIDTSKIVDIKTLIFNQDLETEYTISGVVQSFKNMYIRRNLSIQKALIDDGTGEIELTFFNQTYLKNALREGNNYLFFGKLKKKGNKYDFSPKTFEKIDSEGSQGSIHLGRITPEYSLTKGVSKKWLRGKMQLLLEEIDSGNIQLEGEQIHITTQFDITEDIKKIHFPEGEEARDESIRNISELEIIDVHLKILENLKDHSDLSTIGIDTTAVQALTDEFMNAFEFELTDDQKSVINHLSDRLRDQRRIHTLIQGDVGSGKTVIALYLAFIMSKNSKQSVLLTPTTVLAKQHFESFSKFFSKFTDIDVELVSSENKNAEKSSILVGTSAILARKSKLLANVGTIIVDEQHRFGVQQREILLEEFSDTPHFLNLTATPIPRTIAETFFADLDVQTIKTKPKGRKPVKTFVVPKEKRVDSYTWIENKIIGDKEQVYWIVPLVEESNSLSAKSVKKMHKELSEVFQNINVGFLHGKLKSKEKTEILKQFAEGEIDLLVSTTVIEVGIDVANATVMVIENADRFGLAQLHQIRGRVGRSDKQSYCFLFHDDEITPNGELRLDKMCETTDGLELAEYDLQLRGPGEVYGDMQSGIPDLKIAKLNDIELIISTKEFAKSLYNKGVKRINLFK